MASTAAALNGVLVTAVCAVLLHSSMGQQPSPTTPDCPDHTGQQPVPVPAPAPTPLPVTPPPAPAVDCSSYCTSTCTSRCEAYRRDGLAKCETDAAAAFNGCYDSCTAQNCPGKSCVHSGCGNTTCSCENTNARSCCQSCGSAVTPTYSQCRSSYERGMYYCMLSCTNDCNKNCTQG
ncbi:hypothetical protein PAHAL_3G411800 [Panicum hallii]|jgi:hypothetical protein|uniref:TNFR-Cys domain-containing protein n=1 Tax=Panicum hallii TaxID=206008 RepID=A0A2S3HDP7_9POAL|nr:hypothetical protein PAHAL_3G411800 [Panicum hallii]